MDKKLFACGIFIDLQKGFDTVNHCILLHKLNHYGIRGVINNWFYSYLTGRYQTTQIGSEVSKKKKYYAAYLKDLLLAPYYSYYILMFSITASSDKLDFFLLADDTMPTSYVRINQ